MRFTSAALVETACWEMRLADEPRDTNRALIARVFNGLPPYTAEECASKNIETNINRLDAARFATDARNTYYGAFLKPSRYFNITLDYGPVHKRAEWGSIITREANRVLKRSLPYFEYLRSQAAQTVLYGIGPCFWMDRESLVPRCVNVADVLVPSATLLTRENLSHFALYREWTAMELMLMTRGPKVDPGWNMDTVKAALNWVDQQVTEDPSYAELYTPSKTEERRKADLGWYSTDAVPTIKAWDFYFFSDEGGEEGWRRRIILDTPTEYEAGNAPRKMPPKNRIGQDHGQWLYNPGDKRVYAETLDQIIQWQFGDLTATAPFRYHSVRGLGLLLYAVCHLQNRLHCKFIDATFESLLNLFRNLNPEDAERLTKIDLQNYGVVPQGLEFVKREERWQVDMNLVEMAYQKNAEMMNASATQYREGRQTDTDKREKTATQIMAEVNSANALVGSMLLQGYQYRTFEGIELARRLCIKNSKDRLVRQFRVNVLKAGVPEEALDSSMWNVEPERVLGSGNKILEVAMADKLMAIAPRLDPESQREVDHLYVMANSDRPDLAERLVPLEKGRVSNSVVEANKMFGSLMLGIPIEVEKGLNPLEVIPTLINGMKAIVGQVMKGIKKPSMDIVVGLGTVQQTIAGYLAVLEGDKAQKENVKKFGDQLKEIDNVIEQIAKSAQQQQPQSGGNGADAAKEAIKLQSAQKMGELKIALAAKSHAQRSQGRDVQDRMAMQREQERHELDMKHKAEQAKLDAGVKLLQASSEANKNRIKGLEE